jgi:copper(I)-binding protein
VAVKGYFQEFKDIMKKIALAIALASSLALTGCAVGFDAGTETQGNSGNGRTADVGNIQIRNAVLVADENDQTRATLVATIINKGDSEDSLKSIDAGQTIKVSLSEITLINRLPVSIGYNSEIFVLFTTIGKSLAPGQFVDVTLSFGKNESIKMSLLVTPNTDYYSDVVIPVAEPTVVPTPEPSAS